MYEAEAPLLLSPGPVLRAASRIAWAGTLTGVAGAVAIWIGTALGGGATGPAMIAGFICFAYALALYGWAGARRARLSAIARGMPRALAVWRAAWYCDECDGVFFAASEPPGAGSVIAGQVMTPAAFHHLVWLAGGWTGRGWTGAGFALPPVHPAG